MREHFNPLHELERNIDDCAYKHGIDRQQVDDIFAIELRDRLIDHVTSERELDGRILEALDIDSGEWADAVASTLENCARDLDDSELDHFASLHTADHLTAEETDVIDSHALEIGVDPQRIVAPFESRLTVSPSDLRIQREMNTPSPSC